MKKALIAVIIVLAVIMAGGAVAWKFLPHPLNYDISSIQPVGNDLEIVEDTADFVSVRKTGEGDFKVLLFTDMHLDGDNSTSKTTVSHLVENIQKERPDLVLLGGDNVTSALNSKRCRQLAKIFEKLDVYWAGVLGNHEGDNPFSVTRTKMVDIFSSYDHCLMRRGPDEVTGDCNYSLCVLNRDGGVCQTFFFFDTFDEMSDELKEEYGVPLDDDPYDGVREDQVAWYAGKNRELTEKYGSFTSTVVLHIPLPQYAEAVENGEFLYGDKRENICCSGFDAGLFDAIKACGTTKAVFCGHDHLNNFGIEYEGVLLSYIEPSGYGSYTSASSLGYEEKDWLQGYTALTLSGDGTFVQRQERNSAS